MEELDIPRSAQELGKAIDTLASGKPVGNYGWDEGMVPQDMHDANTTTLYNNKGDCSDCNSYRGILLLSVVTKAFTRVALNRLQSLVERGFRHRK